MTSERWTIPDAWQWKALDEIGQVVGGGTPNTRQPGNFDSNGTPWITPADLSGYAEPYVAGGRRALSEKGLASSGATVLPVGSVLFSSRAPIGYCVIAANSIATNQGFKSLVLNSAMSPEYVREYLAGSVAYAESEARGTTFRELSAAKFAALRIPVAPPQAQTRIAGRLTKLNLLVRSIQGEVAAARYAVTRVQTRLLQDAFSGELTREWREGRTLETAEALIARIPALSAPQRGRPATDRVVEGGTALSVNGKSGRLPPGWAWCPLVRVARQETGHTPSRSVAEYWDGDVPWVGITDAGSHHGRVIQTTVRTISDAGLNNSSARLLPTDAVLLCRTAASIGYVCRLGRPMATSQDFAAWICGPALNPAYLVYLLVGERNFLKRLGRGSAHPTIYMPEIRALHVALAPRDEQDEIVRRLDVAFARLRRIEVEIEAAASLAPALLRRLHDFAFRGLLDAGAPDDENVDVALARHAAELEMRIPKRPARGRKTVPVSASPAEQLAARYDVWPESGYAFEDLREALTGSYEDIRGAIFEALRTAKLSQRFDARRRVMIFVRG